MTRSAHARARGLLAAAFVALVMLSGCTALAKYDAASEPAPFSATSNNLGAIWLAGAGYRPQQRSAFDFALHPAAIPAWVAILPTSVAFDLVTLPYDLLAVPDALRAWKHSDERRWERFRAAAGDGAPPSPTEDASMPEVRR